MSGPHHLPTSSFFYRPRPTADQPLVVMMSACLGGVGCGVDGSTNGDHAPLRSWLTRPEVRLVNFRPEDFSFGTPRMTPNSHGGNGFDVLDGKARSLAEDGTDRTEGMVKAAYEHRDRALRENVELAIRMDVSGACGSSVTYLGTRFAEKKVYQKGPGVAAAALIHAGIPVLSQRDDRSLHVLRDLLEGRPEAEQDGRDHWEKEWYREYYAEPVPSSAYLHRLRAATRPVPIRHAHPPFDHRSRTDVHAAARRLCGGTGQGGQGRRTGSGNGHYTIHASEPGPGTTRNGRCQRPQSGARNTGAPL